MLTKSSISAICVLIYLGREKNARPLSAQFLGRRLRESPTYLSKVLRRMVRSGILETHRGAKGGVSLGRSAEKITLLDIVESCQGILADEACSREDLAGACGFHHASIELRHAVVRVLSRWTLADCLKAPKGRIRQIDQSCHIAVSFKAPPPKARAPVRLSSRPKPEGSQREDKGS